MLPLAVPLISLCALAGNRMESGGRPIYLPGGRLTLHISRTVHLPEGGAGVDRRESAESVHAAVVEAIRAWNQTNAAAVSLDYEWTDATLVSTPDQNVVTFTDFTPFDSGLCDPQAFLACALLRVASESGEILGAAIAFNPYKRHSSLGLDGTHDIGLVMMHEAGHALGLDHSAVLDSVMSAAVEIENDAGAPRFARRVLSMDDITTLAAAYPGEQVTGEWARASGTVTRQGEPLGGAHAVALDERGRAVAGAVTGADGAFKFLLPAGAYLLAVEALDGPVFSRQMVSTRPESGPLPTLFWTSNGGWRFDGERVALEAGGVREGLRFDVGDGAGPNIETAGVIEAGRYLGFPAITLARGRDYTLAATRSGGDGRPVLSLVAGDAFFDGESSVPASAPQLVRRKLRLPADAPCGSYSLLYSDDGGVALMAGALRVTGNPRISAVLDSESGAPLECVRPGQLLRIEGADLAGREALSMSMPDGLPEPNQLEGVSVRLNEAYIPLLAVSPGALLARVPGSLSAERARITVLSGPGIESNVWELPVTAQ